MKAKVQLLLFICLTSLNGQVDYTSQIQTIFTNNCTSCHMYGNASGGLTLTSYSGVMAGGNSGAVIVANDHTNSLLWQKVNSGAMPQNNPALPQSQIDLIALWINEGALESPPTVQKTYVPDDNFEQALIDLGYDDALDDSVMTTNINSVTFLDVRSDSISDLTGIEAFTALDTLWCGHNQLDSLDVSSNTALTSLSCGLNQLTSLTVGSNTALIYLDCHLNQLTSLDVSGATSLITLSCRHNDLTELDVSSNTALTLLNGYGNQLTSLDLSNNTALTYLTCNNNQLTYLNMRNGVTDALTTFNATNNDSLECIETLDPNYATANWTYANGNIDVGVTFADICYASNPSYTYAPDDNFEQALIDLGYDDVLDNYVVTDSINSVTFLNVSNDSISDLTGIEDFIALESLNCSYNQLTSLTLSNVAPMTGYLLCTTNEFTDLDVSGYPDLQNLGVDQNQLTSLDVSNNTELSRLSCSQNQLASLDVTNNTALTALYCNTNQLTTLDVSNNTALTHLYVSSNDLTALDVSNNTALTYLYCRNNLLTSLDVSNNTALATLSCYGRVYPVTNQITALDVSNNTALTTLSCGYNQLTTLDVSNNTALTYLHLQDNDLTTLDVSNNTALTSLYCYNNPLTTLDVTNNTALTILMCYWNQLDSLDVSNNTSLTYLRCDANQLTSLDISNNTALTGLECYTNQLTSLDVSNNTALTHLKTQTNQLTSLDVSNNTMLTDLRCSDNQLTYLNMRNGVTDALTTFNAANNSNLTCIETLDPDYATANWTYANGNIDEGVLFFETCSPGCTDPYADNYDSTAVIDDGSCTNYPDNGEYVLSFDGVDDGVTINDNQSLDLTTASITAWVKSTTSDYLWQTILTKGPEPYESYAIFLKNGTTLHIVNVIDGSRVYWEPTETLTLNDWTYVAVTFDGDTSRAYINGIEVGANALSGSVTSNDYGLEFGIRSGGTALNGMLDEVALWDTVLTQSEIQNNMYSDLSGDEDGLQGYWKFDAGTDTIAYDHSGNANHGDINGASWAVSLTYVPDDNFEQALIDLGYDDVLDDHVVTDSINSVTFLDVSNDSISDLTGIQDFTALTRLECNHNQLTSLDVSNLTSLTYLDCWANDLASLDVSSNTALFSLYCGGNELTILDVSNNMALGGLSCHNNDLTSLDVSANTALTFLECYGNPLGGLDLSSNTALNVLRCLNNQLTSLDVSANTALTFLHCGYNQFTSLDISNNIALTTFYCLSNPLDSLDVSANTALIRLGVSNNQLTSLDVSNNTALTLLKINETQITSLNMRNGITDALTTFDATNNDSLECIETLDPDYATANWTYANGNIDDGVTFSVLCGSTDLSTWYVDTTGSDGQGTGTVGSPFATIQVGINAASSGDTVSVAAGTYVENINYNGKNISLLGEDRDTAIIDGDSSGTVVSFTSGEDTSAVLSGFTITNGLNSVGGGIYVNGSDPTLVDLIVSGNSTGTTGGQPSGGGICLRYSSSSIDNVTFEDNYAYYQGGGIETRYSDILLTNSIFRGNYGGANSGAGWFGFSSDVTIENVLATDNEAHYGYGAFGIYSNTDLDLINSTLTDNESSSGDALGVSSTSNATVSNCIFYNNRDHNGEITGPIRLAGTNSSLDIQYSDVQGGQDAIIMNNQSTVNWGAGNIDAEPLFVDPDSGDYRLSDLSPVISGGIDSLQIDSTWYVVPSTDIEGNPRPNPVGTLPDMGAYENENGIEGYNGPVWYVDASPDLPYANGSSSAQFSKIQHGINASSNGESVLVAAGTYVENINYNGKNISIFGENRETTIIDGDSSGSVVRFEAGEDSTALLSRFTLRNGTGTMINNAQSKGGGINCTGSSPTLTDLKIINNTATTWGGGIHCEYTSNPTITDVFIMENSTNDTASGQGGGLYCWYSAPKLTNVLIANNSSIRGGGVYLGQQGSWAKLTNVTITDNNSVYGGGIWLGYLPPGTQPADKPTVLNSIIWNNTPQQIYYSSGFVSIEMDISYSNIEGGLDSIVTNNNGTVNWGAGNIDNYPFFCEPDSGDYTLAENSSCVGTGEGGANMGAFGIGCGVINQGLYVPENFATIQEGIDAAFVGDTVFVAAGTYLETINFNGKNIAMIGAGQDSTIIDGNQDSTVVKFINGEDSSSVISGFTVKNGQGRNGGGIHCGNNSSPRIQNLVITNNVADFGGGIQCFNSSPTIQNVVITGNTAGNDGGGIHCFNSSPTLENVEITDNIGTWKGGGMGIFSSSDVISQHVTMNNNSSNSGAGVYCSGSNPTFTNSILWNSMTDEIHINSGSMMASYSDVLGGWTGQGNINTEPLFCDPSTGDYYLAQNSPCIGVGQNGSNIGAYGAGCSPILTIASEVLPETYALHQNYPNPFNPITTLRYDLPEDSHVNITIYDMLGRVVKTMVNQTQNAGFRFIIWDATNDYNKPVSAGIYLYQIQAGEYISTKKMVLVK